MKQRTASTQDCCPACAAPIAASAHFCDDCGALLADPSRQPQPTTGPTTRLARRYDAQGACSTRRAWDYAGVPLIGLLFAISTVLSFALTVATLGFSAAHLAVVSMPVAGAVFAQAAWMQRHWRLGLFGMLLSLAVLWGLILSGLQ